MTRIHFIALAAAIAEIKDSYDRGIVADRIGKVCAECNDRFNWKTWYRACNLNPPLPRE